MEGNMMQVVYAVLSILTVTLVIVFGVGCKSNYVPTDKEKDQQGAEKNDGDKRSEGGEPDASTN